MELADSPLRLELDAINEQSTAGIYYAYEATITTENEDIPVLKVVSADWVRNYLSAVSDELILEVAMPAGQFLKRVQPFKENLKISLTRKPFGGGANDPRSTLVQEFRAYLISQDQNDSLGANPATASEDAANTTTLLRAHFQLQELVYEQIRTEMIGGVPKQMTPHALLLMMLYKSIENLQADEANQILGVQAVAPNNTKVRSHFTLPHGTPLTELANILQVEQGGIYNAGIGCYLQSGYWYVWPTYDNKRFDVVEKTASFIILPDPRFKGTEKTWRAVDERHFVAVITGGVSKQDPSEGQLLNDGNAVRFADNDKAMEGFATVTGNKAVAQRTYNNNEYVGVKRRTETNMSRVQTSPTNPYQEASKLAARSMAYLTLNWENSNPDLIIPDLQCEVGFTVDGAPKYINGIVVHAHAMSALSGTGLHQEAHQITTQVVVAVDRNDPVYQAFIDQQNNK